MLSNPAGVHNALRMREMFIKDGYKCRLDIGGFIRAVAVLTVKDSFGLYESSYYFYPDGTYFRGAN